MTIVAIGAAATREADGMKGVIGPKEEKRNVRKSRASQAPRRRNAIGYTRDASVVGANMYVVDGGCGVVSVKKKRKRKQSALRSTEEAKKTEERKKLPWWRLVYFFLAAFSAALVTLPPFSVLSTDLMTPTATVCLMSRTAKRPRGGYSL